MAITDGALRFYDEARVMQRSRRLTARRRRWKCFVWCCFFLILFYLKQGADIVIFKKIYIFLRCINIISFLRLDSLHLQKQRGSFVIFTFFLIHLHLIKQNVYLYVHYCIKVSSTHSSRDCMNRNADPQGKVSINSWRFLLTRN